MNDMKESKVKPVKIKFSILGDSGVGKSSLINSYTESSGGVLNVTQSKNYN